MTKLTRRKLSDDVHGVLPVRMGDALAKLGDKIGFKDEDFQIFNQLRDKTPGEPLEFDQ